MNIEKDFNFLITNYNFEFGHNNFSSYDGFLGPFNAYSFYNDCGCFTIVHAIQRNEIEYFVSREFSREQKVLLGTKISEQIFKILKLLRRNPLNWFKSDHTLLADYIMNEINTKEEFFRIKARVKKT